MKECKYCGTIYEDSQKNCPACGASAIVTEAAKKSAEMHQQREEQRRQEAFDGAKDKGGLKKVGIFAAVAAVLVIALVIILPNLGGAGQGSSEDSLSNKESKAAYEQALTYMAAEDYTGAITELDRIDSGYNKYDDVLAAREEAVAGYKRQAFATVNQYVTKGDYGNALSVLTTMERIIGSDSEVAAKAVEVNKADVMAKVTDYASKQDYAGAIKYINQKLDAVNNDSNILIKLSEMENSYRSTVEAEAAAAFKSGGYEQAISVVNAALSVLSNDSKLVDLHDQYMAYQPVSLLELDYLNQGGLGLTSVSGFRDNFGNEYQSGMVISGDIDSDNITALYKSGWKEYYINRAYKSLSGQFVLAYDYRSTDHVSTLKIYGDGVLLFKADVSAGCDPRPISVDVSNVQKLEIEMIYEKYYAWHNDVPIYAYFADPILTK